MGPEEPKTLNSCKDIEFMDVGREVGHRCQKSDVHTSNTLVADLEDDRKVDRIKTASCKSWKQSDHYDMGNRPPCDLIRESTIKDKDRVRALE